MQFTVHKNKDRADFMIRFLASLIVLIGIIAVSKRAKAQDFSRDTSYTIHSAYAKYVKQYPDIEIAEPDMDDQVSAQYGVIYKNTGYRTLKLDIFHPSFTVKNEMPVVLMVHGGGWISGDKSLLYPLAKVIAAKQYIAVTMEYRLSPEAEYPAAVYDIKTALKWIKDHADEWQGDSSKVAILGTSAGGQLAALAGTTEELLKFEDPADTSSSTTNINAIVDIDGVLAFIHPVSEEGTVASKWLGGNQQEARQKWLEASALTHVDDDTPPTMFIGSSYPRFLAGHKEYMKVLSAEGIYTEKYTLNEAPHSFWLFHPWFEPTANYTIQFLDKVLKSE